MSKDNENLSQKKNDCPSLRELYFYLTDGCNLACRHCWLAPGYDKTGDKSRFLPKETFSLVIDEARPLGLTAVKLTGGEPLLHPEFAGLVRIVADNNLRLNLETNGLLCDAAVAREIAQLPQKSVAISLDGVNPATHDRIRGVTGAFEKTCAAVRQLAGVGVPPQIIMTVMTANVDQVESMIALAENLGAGSVKFNVVQPTARGESLYKEALALDIKEVIDLGERVQAQLAGQTELKVFFDFPMAFRSLKSMFYGGGCSVCGIFGIMGVLADGHYALCGIGSHVPELVFGEAGKNPLAEVWRDN